MKTNSNPCPCGSAKNFIDCCARYLDNNQPAPTAEVLMRSRYTAYTLRREDYLLATWHSTTRPTALDLAEDTNTIWIGLEVKRHEQHDKDQSIVEFIARYKVNGRAYRMQEISRFVREDGCWFYVDGKVS